MTDKITVTSRQLGAILAGLHLLQQRKEGTFRDVSDIETCGDSQMPLDVEEIDELCEFLNSEAFVDDEIEDDQHDFMLSMYEDHPEHAPEHIRAEIEKKASSYEVHFSFLVPVSVVVEDDVISRVIVHDDTEVNNPVFVEGDEEFFKRAVKIATSGDHLWPSWQFGW